MDSPSLLYGLSWLCYLWLVGWLALPLARFVFVNLPDGGLAAGRTLAVALIALLVFWGAALHLAPLTLAPLWILGLPLLAAVLTLRRATARAAFRQWVQVRRSALLWSDSVFLAAFLFFLWMRLRHPEINDLEKPFDSAIIGGLLRTRFLPAQNTWLSGHLFTNYYYFGHFMGALLARALATPLPYAYNLILTAFSALFVAPLWSLCAALTGTARRGVAAMSMVALLGNFQPLRAWVEANPANQANLFRLNWWETSRVIPNTINEYPIFTLSIGDAHGHFFALALAALFFCLCYALFTGADAAWATRDARAWLDRRHLVLILIGVLLGLFWMTNTWDLPIYGGLALCCAVWTLIRRQTGPEAAEAAPIAAPPARSQSKKKRKAKTAAAPSTTPPPTVPPPTAPLRDPLEQLPAELVWLLLPVALARAVAAPYLSQYHPQVSGVVREFWSYPVLEFALFWGGFLVLWLVAMGKLRRPYWIPFLIVAALTTLLGRGYLAFLIVFDLLLLTMCSIAWPVLQSKRAATASTKQVSTPETATPQEASQPAAAVLYGSIMAMCGLLALLAPMLFYVKGVFGGDLRHQDTVFKFFIEAWLLLGTAAACGAITTVNDALKSQRALQWLVGLAWAALWTIPFACAANVVWTRALLGDPGHNPTLSLDGARWVSPGDRAALEWLAGHAGEDETVLEAVGPDSGHGDWKPEFGRVAALTGVATPIGWGTHVSFWAAASPEDAAKAELWSEINQRADAAQRVYSWPDNATALAALRRLGVRYVFVGDTERTNFKPDALARLRAALPVRFTSGDTFVAEVRPGE